MSHCGVAEDENDKIFNTKQVLASAVTAEVDIKMDKETIEHFVNDEKCMLNSHLTAKLMKLVSTKEFLQTTAA